jgi:hypothetical protein
MCGAILRFKRRCLKDTSRHGLKTTNPCAIAYGQARIRRLVRLGGGFYCGAVADCSVIGFSSPANFQGTLAPPIFLWRLAWGTSVRRDP